MWSRKLSIIGILIFLVACGTENAKLNEYDVETMIKLAADGENEQLKRAIDTGVNIDVQDAEGFTPVMAATVNGETETVALLIEKGANIDIQNNRADNVLLYAGAEGMLDIVQLAIEAGADTTITNRFGGTALIPAADRGHVDIVQYLLVHSNIDIDHINNLHWTALLEAVILGDGGEAHTKIVRLLLEHDADTTITDGDGVTALQHAEAMNYEEMVDLLK